MPALKALHSTPRATQGSQRVRRKQGDPATERQVRALIDRIKNGDHGPPMSSSPEDTEQNSSPGAQDLEAREREIADKESSLEREILAVKRQRAAVRLQRRERELREAAATALRADEERLRTQTEQRVGELRADLEHKERACEARRAELQVAMERIRADYAAARDRAAKLREEYQEACDRAHAEAKVALGRRRQHHDDAIRRQLERDALALGFRMTPRSPAS